MFMANPNPLKDISVLVTRPQAQALPLTQLIEQAGGKSVVFPLIEIQPIPSSKWSSSDWRKVDILIFISRNAVTYFKQGYPAKLPKRQMLVAVGQGTAEAMQEQGYSVDVCPAEGGGTEDLLNCLDLNNLAHKKVAIVRGRGGRELLAESLRANGAEVRYIEVYKRQMPHPSSSQLAEARAVDIVLATSIQSVSHLIMLFAEELETFIAKPLVVISERIRQYALSQGFQQVSVSAQASDAAILQQLLEIGQHHGK